MPKDATPRAAPGRGAERGPATAPPSCVVATAGHVDHGKSTLVSWLTGTNPDRLAEEQRRGLTIDLGFAATALPSGVEIGFVDVPGHVRFLKNMVAGVGAVAACLFVVAATEGWKPQSEDHLRILEVIGVAHGVVALTHAGLVDDETLAIAREEVADHVAGSFLEGAPVVPVDVFSGIGTGAGGLRAALAGMVAQVPPPPDRGRPRLWIDRAFAIRGAGSVVTGTLAGGRVAVGDHLEIAPFGTSPARAPVPVRVRGLESYGRRIDVADPGRRLAVNVAGADRDRVARGAALVEPGRWHRCAVADATLTTLPHLGHATSRRGAYLAHLGTGEQAVRLRVLGRGGEVAPGETGTVRLWLSAPLPLVPGDRYVLREAGRREVVGGGTLLDVAPVLPVARARPTASVARVVAERGWVDADELERLTGTPATPTLARWVVDPGVLARARDAVRARVRAAGPSGLDLSVLDERERAIAGTLGDLTVSHGIARVPVPSGAMPRGDVAPDGATAPDGAGPDLGAVDADLHGHPYLAALRAAPFTPPSPDGVDRNDLRRLVRSGLVVETNGVWFAASAVDTAARRIAARLEHSDEGVRVADVRDALGTSRRYVLALLAHLDAAGITRRDGDVRSAGPMMPPPTGDAVAPERTSEGAPTPAGARTSSSTPRSSP